MDQFYLRNVAQYEALVGAFVPPPAMTSGNLTKANAPGMVVSARIRPFLEEDKAAGFPSAVFPRAAPNGVIDIHDLYNHPRGRPILKSFNYSVDKVFTPEVSTEQIFDDLLVGLIPFVQNGGVGTVFAYGQTGSGKTFTISRLQELAVEALLPPFESQPTPSGSPSADVQLTIIELAGNSAFDLLSERKPISILEDSHGTIHLSGASEHPISTPASALSLIEIAASFRRTASTLKNDASSRSHSICRIRVLNPSTNTQGFLYLVDLAGSEAARDVATHGAERMRETKEINMSLSVLKDCIRGRAEWDVQSQAQSQSQSDSMIKGKKSGKPKPKPRIPFRQSALTKVLKHVFDISEGSGSTEGGRETRTVVIACVNPSLGDVAATKNTLRYAEMLRVAGLVSIAMGEKGGKEKEGPMGWGNREVRRWIGENSGEPKISADILAPTETGAEMLRMSMLEFEYRCMKSPGVTAGQAKALRSKFWKFHAES
ncbi:P-loop containing nucleoside triphosphate hydrolase protein [Cercophora newfieldiana]|uniref:P-loop containing nucleoside triphosphate hydrolase protein n=1 Tax=Cercophora newfieldiana TaxID=92897 RepID=A0AA39YBS3_9PEZI|nr:P-loop containing nucleoside triphosphate hydrolase protein [Cercophora newfieldiana]